MGFGNKKKSGKNATAANPLPADLQERLLAAMPADGLPCATAFALSTQLNITPTQIGNTADLHGVRLTKCQLGLFGYQPRKKCIEPKVPSLPELEQALVATQDHGRISCTQVWNIAERLNLPKMEVSAACEALKIKISACQLGAF